MSPAAGACAAAAEVDANSGGVGKDVRGFGAEVVAQAAQRRVKKARTQEVGLMMGRDVCHECDIQ
jgi:hypothetical protein